MSEEGEELEELRAERDRWKNAHRIACVGITQLNDQKADLTRALESACLMIDACLTEMRVKDQTASPALLVQKMEFDKAMRRLLGRDREQAQALDT